MNERLKGLGDIEVPGKQSGVASRCQTQEELCKMDQGKGHGPRYGFWTHAILISHYTASEDSIIYANGLCG